MQPLTQTLQAILPPARLLTLQQFLRFGTVGLAGFGVDVACVYLLRGLVGLFWAGMAAYLAAATTTWALNRVWTFAGARRGGLFRQWLLFLGANGLGFTLNRGTFILLVALVPLCERQPVLAIAAGVAAGMFVNFNMSRRVVFR